MSAQTQKMQLAVRALFYGPACAEKSAGLESACAAALAEVARQHGIEVRVEPLRAPTDLSGSDAQLREALLGNAEVRQRFLSWLLNFPEEQAKAIAAASGTDLKTLIRKTEESRKAGYPEIRVCT